MKRDLYALHDDPSSPHRGAIKIAEHDARDYNSRGFGIFWAVNKFGERRTKENLVELYSWFVEIDGLPKPQQLALIESGLIPSLVVESKNGYHVYFNANGATIDSWREIMGRVGAFYSGDPRARLVTQLARVPGYLHQKDQASPYLVQQIWSYDVRYTEKIMLSAYKPVEKPGTVSSQRVRTMVEGQDFWDRIYNFDCVEGLKRLSGSHFVGGEAYSFRSATGGNKNIVVNGKATSCFIDSHGRIGSSDKGGPSLYQWLKWYGHTPKMILNILRQFTPEVFK